jgi:hypothetical protein
VSPGGKYTVPVAISMEWEYLDVAATAVIRFNGIKFAIAPIARLEHTIPIIIVLLSARCST